MLQIVISGSFQTVGKAALVLGLSFQDVTEGVLTVFGDNACLSLQAGRLPDNETILALLTVAETKSECQNIQ